MTDSITDKGAAPSADEVPKKQVAKSVITTKRQYFFPEHGRSVEADSLEKAQAIIDKDNNRKEGDD